jgi:hypothetical protein
MGATEIIAQGFNPGIRWKYMGRSSIGTTDLFSWKIPYSEVKACPVPIAIGIWGISCGKFEEYNGNGEFYIQN